MNYLHVYIQLVRQYKAHGLVTETLLPVVDLDNAVGLMVFSVSIVLTGMAAVWAFFRFRRGSFGPVEQRQDAPAPGPSHDAPADIRPASEGQVRYRPEDYYPKEPEDTDDDPEEIHTLPGSKDGDDE